MTLALGAEDLALVELRARKQPADAPKLEVRTLTLPLPLTPALTLTLTLAAPRAAARSPRAARRPRWGWAQG